MVTIFRKNKVKKIMKILGLHEYLIHLATITAMLNGTDAALFSKEEARSMLQMFDLVQPAFDMSQDEQNGTISFPFLNYVANKFCQFFGFTKQIAHFPLLRDRAKLQARDRQWEVVCRLTNIPFHSSFNEVAEEA